MKRSVMLSAQGKSSSILSEMANADVRSKPLPTLSHSALDQLELGRVEDSSEDSDDDEDGKETTLWQTGSQEWSMRLPGESAGAVEDTTEVAESDLETLTVAVLKSRTKL